MRTLGRWQRWAGVATAATLGMSLWGCPKSDTDTASGPNSGGAPTPGKKVVIAVIPKGTSNSYWQTLKTGADDAAKKNGVEIDWDGPADETSFTQQIDLFKNKITKGVNGVVLAAISSESLVNPVKEAMDKGIPIVMVDSGLPKNNDPSYCYIATDNVEGGRQAATALAKEIGDKGKVGVLGFVKGSGSNDERLQGFTEEIAKHKNIQVVSTLYDDSNTAKALDQTANMLTANPDIIGIFAANEPGGVGAGNCIKQKNLIGKVKIVAFDSSPDEVKDLKAGIIQALIVQDPYQMGYKGVEQVLAALKKEPAAKKFVDSGVSVVTKENMDKPEIQKLLK